MSTPVLVPPPIAAEPPAPKHPIAFIFHFAFKVAAMVFYILCETVNKNQFVLNFVVCIVLLAMDFWTVSFQTAALLAFQRRIPCPNKQQPAKQSQSRVNAITYKAQLAGQPATKRCCVLSYKRVLCSVRAPTPGALC